MYKCYLDGKFYGRGNLVYIASLFTNYVRECELYGKKECTFKVEKVELKENI